MKQPSFEIEQAARSAALRALVLGAIGTRLADAPDALLLLSGLRMLSESVTPAADSSEYAAQVHGELDKLFNQLEVFALAARDGP